ncbi:type II toxin-antitoxin system RelB family antitoxin [Oceanivirga salmonicida]|uniref:type II toxin-antitoxin system RelB family antitoxin n=1 Tax=Oceanivirga salmonicida TaxID=1769291 RepID=UPI0008353A10|nr:DUF6290 family protein [Oceanivirga salmonicida]
MAVLSLRLDDKELKLIKEYSKIHNMNVSSFVRDLILDKLDDELDMEDEKRIYNLWQESKNEKTYSASSVFEELGI